MSWWLPMWSRCCTRRPDPRAEPPPPHRTQFARQESLPYEGRRRRRRHHRTRRRHRICNPGLGSGLRNRNRSRHHGPQHHPLRSHRLRELQRAADPSERHRSHARLQVEPAGHFPGPAPQHRAPRAAAPRWPKPVPQRGGRSTVGPCGVLSLVVRNTSSVNGVYPGPAVPFCPEERRVPARACTARPRPPPIGARLRISAPHPSPGTLRLAPTGWRWAGPSPSPSPS